MGDRAAGWRRYRAPVVADGEASTRPAAGHRWPTALIRVPREPAHALGLQPILTLRSVGVADFAGIPTSYPWGFVLSAAATLLPVLTGVTSAAGDGEGFHAPTLQGEFFPPAFLFEGTIFELNRIMLVRLVATIALVTVFWLAARRARLVPGRFQGAIEMALDFVRVSIAEEVLGKESGRRQTTLLTIVFFGIFAMNITGVIPLLNIAGSSVIGVPLVFAVVAYVAFIVAGIRAQGAGGFFKSSLFPAGVPKFLYIILTPIEFLSTFILRPVTLTIRLLANMLVGHLLLVLCFGATHYLFFEAAGAMSALGGVTFVAGLAFTVFEIFIAALQAFIFTLLTAVYIQLSEDAH